MKIKKALKKLDKAESLLSSIIDEYDTAEEPRLKEALAAAKESVGRVKETVNHAPRSRRPLESRRGKPAQIRLAPPIRGNGVRSGSRPAAGQ